MQEVQPKGLVETLVFQKAGKEALERLRRNQLEATFYAAKVLGVSSREIVEMEHGFRGVGGSYPPSPYFVFGQLMREWKKVG